MKNIKQTNNFITNKKREQMTFKLLIEKKPFFLTFFFISSIVNRCRVEHFLNTPQKAHK